MRIIALILACVILTETVFSCAVSSCCESHDETSEKVSTIDTADLDFPINGSTEDDEKKDCSPFCGCCFHPNTVQFSESSHFSELKPFSIPNYFYLDKHSKIKDCNIWQPPKAA